MKKIYLSALSLAVATGLSAQVGTTELAPKKSNFGIEKGSSYQNFEKVSLWSNDISTATDWAFTNTSSPAQDWYIETDPNAVPTYAPVGTASAANGFLMIDSDVAGSSATQDAYATYTGVIDLTGNPYVTLEFDHHYRAYQETRSVDVSTDDFATFTTYEVTASSVANVNVSETFTIDISGGIAGDPSNVKIRFHYEGSFGWYWAVDDINIKTTEPYDLRADGTTWGVTGAWGSRFPYYSTPIAQIQPIEFCGIFSNIGVNDVSDATYTVDIPSLYNASGTMNSVAGNNDTLCASSNFTPAAVGSFTASASMSTSNPDTGTSNNDFDDVTFAVSDYVYARDNADNAASLGSSYNQGYGYELGNMFDIFAAADLTAVLVGISSQTEVNSNIIVKFYSIDPNPPGNSIGDALILVDQSQTHVVQASEVGTIISIPLFNGPHTLNAGESYFVSVSTDGDGGVSDDLTVITSGDSEPQTTFFFDQTDNTWYYTTATPVVRMNFDPSASVIEKENVFGIKIFPNPANTDANLTFSLNNTADVNITITDLSGKVVYTDALGAVAAGTTEVAVNTAALSNGVYMINVAADNAVSTEKLVIRK